MNCKHKISVFILESMNRTTRLILLIITLLTTAANNIFGQALEQKPGADWVKTLPKTCPEKIFVHTDRDVYVAGENLLYKIYVVPSLPAGKSVSNIAYLVLRNEKQNILRMIVTLSDGYSFGSVYLPDTLQTGMYELVAFTNYMKNYNEEIFFKKQLMIANRFDKLLDNLYQRDTLRTQSVTTVNRENQFLRDHAENQLHLTFDKNKFTGREKIKITITLDSASGAKDIVNASLSVKAVPPIRFSSWPLDSTVSASGQGPAGRGGYLPEESGVYVSGNYSDSVGRPQPGECLIICTSDTIPNLQYSFTNDSGRFVFSLPDFYLGRQLLLKPLVNETSQPGKKIILEDKFRLNSSFLPSMPEMNTSSRKYIFTSQDIVQVQKTYPPETRFMRQPANKIDGKAFPWVFTHPESVIIPASFVPLDNMEEIASNILYGLTLKERKSIYQFYLFDNLTKTYFTQPSLVFLDGIVADNVNQFMNLKSDDIERIALCNSQRTKGEIDFPGIVSITTKKKQPDYITPNLPAIYFQVDRYQEKTWLKAPEYSVKNRNNTTPDFRQLLYWNPEIVIHPNQTLTFEFYASDYLSDYLVELNGFTSDGKFLKADTQIEVTR